MFKKATNILIVVFLLGLLIGNLSMPENVQKLVAAPVRGVPGDNWADAIIGQPNFGEVVPFTVSSTSFHLPHGVFIDTNNPSDNKMYVYDAGNSRILGYDLEDCLDNGTDPLNCEPDLLFGQPNFNSSACNGDGSFQNYPTKAPASASTLCGMEPGQLSISEGGSGASMDVDSDGNLYFPDFTNNRVLKFNDPFNTDTIADEVWGQADFTGIECNRGSNDPAANTLCFNWGSSNNWTAGVDIDSTGNLWIADSGNNRVLRFPNNAGTISKTADLVLGQSSFTTKTFGNGLNQLRDPNVVRVNSAGTVYVSERYNNRVMKYETPSTGASGVTFGSGFNAPSGIDFDPTEPDRLWISNSNDSYLELWDEDSETLVRTIGNGDGNILGDVTGSVGFDSNGNAYGATGTGNYNNTVLIFESGESTTVPTRTLTEPTSYGNTIDTDELGASNGIVVTDDQLIVADVERIMFWNTPSGVDDLTTGKPADGFILKPSLAYGGCCFNLKQANNKLYTVTWAHDLSSRVLIYDLPLTNLSEPVEEVAFPLNLLGGGTIGSDTVSANSGISGIAPSPDGNFLWISVRNQNRVVRVRDPFGTPQVDIVLGQTNSTNNQCNQGGSETNLTLCAPGTMSYDTLGNFYLSDHWLEADGNNRLLIYNSDTFPTDNGSVIYTEAPDKIIEDIAGWEPAFDSQNRMVVGYNPYWTGVPFELEDRWFPGIYEDILNNNDGIPDAHLNDYYSMPYPAAFDADDNLYVGDLNRGRVMVYFAPLEDIAPILAEVTPVTTPTIDTTPNYTFSSTEAGTINYAGDCSSSTTAAVSGSNTITFNTLSIGVHSNCEITVTDDSMNVSEILNVSPFTIVATPVLSQVTAVPNPVADRTPDYTFNSNKSGSLTYTGDCSSSTTSTSSGNRTITFNSLSIGTHSNCTIRLTDSDGFQSNILNVNSFAVSFKIYGDLNSDGSVGLSDLSILATYWQSGNSAADINNDAVVNISDLSIIASNWLNSY